MNVHPLAHVPDDSPPALAGRKPTHVSAPMSKLLQSLDAAGFGDKPVGLFGLGVSGQAVLDLFQRAEVPVIAYDEREGEDARRGFGPSAAKQHAVVVYSPGFRLDHPWLVAAREAGCLCVGEMELAARFWHGELIAVTGTNGKTTLSEFLAYALKRQGHDAVAAGNNGYPLSRLAGKPGLEGTVAICETSSFQCESLYAFRAEAIFWTNFSETHLDRYGEMEPYFRAKWRLLKCCQPKGRIYVGEEVVPWAERFGLNFPAQTRIIPRDSTPKWHLPEQSAFHPPAQRANLALAAAFWKDRRLPPLALRRAAETFAGRAHRLHCVGEVLGVSYWNDSKATNFAATLGALDRFATPPIWIGGGQDRGGDVEGFARQMASRVSLAIVYGQAAPTLQRAIIAAGGKVEQVSDLTTAVEIAWHHARAEGHVLFSPGFASQDQFPSYAERGSSFENAVAQLRHRTDHPHPPSNPVSPS